MSEIVELYHVTDAMNPECFALETVLGKLKELYKEHIQVHTVMGVPLEEWEEGNDRLYDSTCTISSYTVSRVYKAIQKLNPPLAEAFLHRAREAVFTFNQNIEDDASLIAIVNELDLNGTEILAESKTDEIEMLLNEDYMLSISLDVNRYPTVVMINEDGEGIEIEGVCEFEQYVTAVNQILIKKG